MDLIDGDRRGSITLEDLKLLVEERPEREQSRAPRGGYVDDPRGAGRISNLIREGTGGYPRSSYR